MGDRGVGWGLVVGGIDVILSNTVGCTEDDAIGGNVGSRLCDSVGGLVGNDVGKNDGINVGEIVGDIDIVGPTLGDSVQILVIKFCPPPVIYDDVGDNKHAATQTSLLSSKFNDVNNLLLHKVDGIVPDKELPFKLSDTILDSIPSDEGMIPTSLFDCRFK